MVVSPAAKQFAAAFNRASCFCLIVGEGILEATRLEVNGGVENQGVQPAEAGRDRREHRSAVGRFADVKDISAATIPPDFERNARIHRTWRVTAR